VHMKCTRVDGERE